jgi:hypothetical protein
MNIVNPGACGRRLARGAAVCALTAMLSLVAPDAWAHGGATSAPQAVTYDMGDLQIRAVMGAVARLPGPMLIDLSLTTPAGRETPVVLRAWPSTQDRPADPEATVRLLAGEAGPYPTQVRIDRAGPWDVELELTDIGAPVAVARIPITVPVPATDPAEPGRSISYAAAGMLAVTGIAVALVARRRSRRISAVAMWVTGPVCLAALVVAVTLSVVRVAPVDVVTGRPAVQRAHVNVALSTREPAPQAGRPTTLERLLTDGSTGQPVDDVVPNHEALLHVALIGPVPQDFAHLHPARIAPGRYRLQWTPQQPGPHVVEVELARAGTGPGGGVDSQVVEQTIDVVPAVAPAPPSGPAGGIGPRTLDGLDVDLRSTGPLTAGEPVGLSAAVTANGRPVDLRPWLGMTGHLMIRNVQAGLFAHVHAVGPMPAVPAPAGVRAATGDPTTEWLRSRRDRQPAPEAATAAPASVVRFAYTFPTTGRYDAWMQFRHGDRVATVPMSLEVR